MGIYYLIAWAYNGFIELGVLMNKYDLFYYLQELHKKEYWTKPELSVSFRCAEKRSIHFIEQYMRRLLKNENT